MNIAESIGALRAALEEIDEHLPVLDSASEHVANAEAKAQAAEEQETVALANVRQLQVEHDQKLAEGEAKLAAQQADHEAQVKAHTDTIETLRGVIEELQVKISSLRQEHDQILASLESIKKKHFD